MSKDPWIHEDDADTEVQTTPANGEASEPVAASEETASAPKVEKPNVAPDPTIPTLVLPKPVIVAASEETASAPMENEFPNDYGECLKISATMQGADELPDRPTPSQKARSAKFIRLKAHIFNIQQGSPVLHTDAHSKGAFIGLHHAGLVSTKLRYLARSNREVKQLIENHEKACATNETLLTENANLRDQIAKLTAK